MRAQPLTSEDVIDVEALEQLVAWNAPDHEHTRISARRALEQALDEAIAAHCAREQSAQTPSR